MKTGNPKKSVNRESHYAQSVRGADYPSYDLNNPALVVSHYTQKETGVGAERVDRVAF